MALIDKSKDNQFHINTFLKTQGKTILESSNSLRAILIRNNKITNKWTFKFNPWLSKNPEYTNLHNNNQCKTKYNTKRWKIQLIKSFNKSLRKVVETCLNYKIKQSTNIWLSKKENSKSRNNSNSKFNKPKEERNKKNKGWRESRNKKKENT